MKIAISAISKNETKFVRRFCESAKEADLIHIADTGSDDDTVKVARECGAVVDEIYINPWRFDAARNAALALIPKDIDIVVSLDLDEVLEPGWRQEIERVWQKDTTRLRYKYDWGQGICFYSEKVFSRNGYYWHHPCHEYPVADSRTTESFANTEYLLARHLPDPEKSRGQYLDLLELSIKEDPNCPRNAFYYARELTFYNEWEKSIVQFNRYLALPTATWSHERAFAMRLLGKAHQNCNRWYEALKWYRLACAEAPDIREPWVDLAHACYQHGLWHECYSAAMNALNITNKVEVYTMEPSAWGEKPYDLASVAAYNLGCIDKAIRLCKEAMKFAPNDARIQLNLRLMEKEDTNGGLSAAKDFT